MVAVGAAVLMVWREFPGIVAALVLAVLYVLSLMQGGAA